MKAMTVCGSVRMSLLHLPHHTRTRSNMRRAPRSPRVWAIPNSQKRMDRPDFGVPPLYRREYPISLTPRSKRAFVSPLLLHLCTILLSPQSRCRKTCPTVTRYLHPNQ